MTTIIEQAIKGKRRALENLYVSNKQKVFYTALLLTGSSNKAAEATNYGFRNALSNMAVHSVTTEEDFTHLVIHKTADYCKKKVSKKDNKAFHIPQGRNFLIFDNNTEKMNTENTALRVVNKLPILQKYIFVLHNVGNYQPKQLAHMFKFDMQTISIALDTEQTNAERILHQLGKDNLSYADLISELQMAENDVPVPFTIDEYVSKAIDSIAGPIEQRAKKRVLTVCTSALAVLILVMGIILIIKNTGGNTTTSGDGSDTSANSSTSNSTLISEPIIELDENLTYYADIEIEDYGTITVELNQEVAPVTVANFVNLAQNGFYDGLTFHRIVDTFVMQGGCPDGDGYGSNTDEDGNEINIVGEFSSNGYENNLSHTRGAISMARSSEYNSASSQFFIVHTDDYIDVLDGEYAVFGYVTEGIEIVDNICESAEPTDSNGTIEAEDQPVITSITIRTVDNNTDAESDTTDNETNSATED